MNLQIVPHTPIATGYLLSRGRTAAMRARMILLCVLALLSGPASGAIVVGGYWAEVWPNNPAGWTSSTSAQIGRTYGHNGTVTVDGGSSLQTLDGYLAYSSGSSGTVTVTGTDSTWTNGGYLDVGFEGSGALIIADGGKVSNGTAIVGYNTGSSGTATVTGYASDWTNSSYLYVGYNSNGMLTVENGGHVSNTTGYIGSAGGSGSPSNSSGTATVTGAGSVWTNSSSLYVGRNGSGTLVIESGGVVSSIGGYLGDNAVASGTAIVTGAGSTWTSGSLSVGGSGSGSLTVQNGGTVTTSSGTLGSSADSTGTATVTGIGSSWANSRSLSVGQTGIGGLTVEKGGQVSNAEGYLGYNTGSTGTVTVTGAGSTWTNSANAYVGRNGSGTLLVECGANVSSVAGYIGYNTGSYGTVTVTGAGSTWANKGNDLSVGRSGIGTLTIADGGKVSNMYSYLGYELGSSGTATVSGVGSTWASSLSMYVGLNGSGALAIANGGKVSIAGYTGQFAIIGCNAGSSGTTTVNGAGSSWAISGWLTVGSGGSGALTIADSAKVSNTDGEIGYNSGSNGTVTVTGAGSKWTNSDLYVGRSGGSGTLLIGSGGAVSSASGYVGGDSGSKGIATVTGATSTWANSSALYVGVSSSGALIVADGGKVSNTMGVLGCNPGSNGTATVTGGNSTWTSSSALYVGASGSGSLIIADGGKVSNTYCTLGLDPGSRGTATVTGGGSTWASSYNLEVGSEDYDGNPSGTGSLTVADSGKVTAQWLSVNKISSLNLHVTGSNMLVLGNATDTGEIANSGTVNLYAAPFLAAGTYTPISEYASRPMWWGTGSYKAFGGTWDDGGKFFTVTAPTVLTAGVADVVNTGERLLITDSGSGQQVAASFGFAPDGTTFSASVASGSELTALALLADGAVLSAWNFATNLTGNEVRLSFDIGPGQSNLEIWHYDGTSWTPYAAGDLMYGSDGIVSFTVNGFSGYAVTSVPDPTTMSLLVIGSLAILRRKRK